MTATIERAIAESQTQASQVRAKVVWPGEGEVVEAFGDCVRNILTSEDTNAELMLMVDEAPAGSGPPLHVHTREDEIWIIQSGRYEFQIDGKTVEAEAGTVVYGPREIPHTFRVISETPGRSLTLLVPGGFEQFFKRSAVEFATGAPDIHKIFQIGAEHGITFLTPESTATYRAAQPPGAAAQPKIVRPDEGMILEMPGQRARGILLCEDTQGQCVLSELEVQPGCGPALHVHTREDEVFIIQDGKFDFQIGDEHVQAGPGTILYGPRDIPHGFRAVGEIPGRMLVLIAPGELQYYCFIKLIFAL